LKDHKYSKLAYRDKNFGDEDQMKEGEGLLTVSEEVAKEKKNKSDFALWKKSKPNEPFWDSPWSKGRPGWHV